ncbi:MAG: YeeE/YedE family protein [Alphaproteobacteria bacterium]|nr:YeeE/YedE family protein [Alphaproteobacteria bacterium]
MARILAALAAGLLFGAGLAISQMMNPAKVLGFLDIGAIPSGGWDPSLAFVMAGALALTLPLYALARRRTAPLFETRFAWPTRSDLDGKLLAGAAIFGAGWGLVGFCPGPALAALAQGGVAALVFFGAMLAGMALFSLTMDRKAA